MPNNATKSPEQALEEQRLWLQFGSQLAGIGAGLGQTVIETSAQQEMAARNARTQLEAARLAASGAGSRMPIAAPAYATPTPMPASDDDDGIPGWLWPVGIGAAALGAFMLFRK